MPRRIPAAPRVGDLVRTFSSYWAQDTHDVVARIACVPGPLVSMYRLDSSAFSVDGSPAYAWRHASEFTHTPTHTERAAGASRPPCACGAQDAYWRDHVRLDGMRVYECDTCATTPTHTED